jgi:hypothetical protein
MRKKPVKQKGGRKWNQKPDKVRVKGKASSLKWKTMHEVGWIEPRSDEFKIYCHQSYLFNWVIMCDKGKNCILLYIVYNNYNIWYDILVQ